MESCPEMLVSLVHMSFSSAAQTIILHMQLVGKNIQNTISCNYYCCCVYQNNVKYFQARLCEKKYRHLYNFLLSNSSKFKCIFNIIS